MSGDNAPMTVAILGFGRSGTTWLSDIVSKAAGRALLFEPWHPEVLPESRDLSYRTSYTAEESEALSGHLRAMLAKQRRNAWLLRNHLPAAVHEIDARFVDQVWDEIEIIGFKAIRASMVPDWVMAHAAQRCVFLVRHPLAVVASIHRRSNFWEFGWPDTFDLFIRNALDRGDPTVEAVAETYARRPAPEGVIDRIALMWAITHAVALPRLERAGIPVLFYEDLYDHPFLWARTALAHLGLGEHGLLPTYLFTPAMTTHRTLHGTGGLYDAGGERIALDFFWRETLDAGEQRTVLGIVEAFGVDLYAADGTPA